MTDSQFLLPKTGRRDYAPVEDRKHLTPKQKAELCLKQEGRCAGCRKKPIHGWEFDHIDELWESGSNAIDNWQAFGSRKDCECHSVKTGESAKRRARMNRLRHKTGQIARRKARGALLKSNPQIPRPPVSPLNKHSPGYRKAKFAKRSFT